MCPGPYARRCSEWGVRPASQYSRPPNLEHVFVGAFTSLFVPSMKYRYGMATCISGFKALQDLREWYLVPHAS